MRRIIEQLKRQREEAKDKFVDNSLINSMSTGPNGINTNHDLDVIRELNNAISCLENATVTKEEGEEGERMATEEDYISTKTKKMKNKSYTEDEVKSLITKAYGDFFNYGHYDDASYWIEQNLNQR